MGVMCSDITLAQGTEAPPLPGPTNDILNYYFSTFMGPAAPGEDAEDRLGRAGRTFGPPTNPRWHRPYRMMMNIVAERITKNTDDPRRGLPIRRRKCTCRR